MAESESQLLWKHKSKACELMCVIIYVVVLAIMASVTLAAGDKPSIIYVLAVVLALAMSPAAAFMGGLLYEAAGQNLIIRSGLLRIPIKRIPLESIRYITISDYKVLNSIAWGWYNKFPDGTKGYVRGFKGKAVILHTGREKYLLASENPEQLKSNIEEHLAKKQVSTEIRRHKTPARRDFAALSRRRKTTIRNHHEENIEGTVVCGNRVHYRFCSGQSQFVQGYISFRQHRIDRDSRRCPPAPAGIQRCGFGTKKGRPASPCSAA